MKRNMSVFMLGFITCFMLFGSLLTAFAGSNGTSISALLNSNLKIMLNGSDFNAKDSNGNVLLPITYNSRTYLPVGVLAEALNVPIQYESNTNTVWIGEKSEIVKIINSDYYSNYYGTVITQDSSILKSDNTTYKWGITNNEIQTMADLGCHLSPQGKFNKFEASTYVDSGVGMDLVLEIRRDTFDGTVLKTYTLKPGQTINIEADITGVNELFITTELKIDHDEVTKFIIGEPIFKN